MIVQCENCQTKYNLPDDKIPPTGRKVKCSKCSHVFTAMPPAAAAPAPPPAPEPEPEAPAPPPEPEPDTPDTGDDDLFGDDDPFGSDDDAPDFDDFDLPDDDDDAPSGDDDEDDLFGDDDDSSDDEDDLFGDDDEEDEEEDEEDEDDFDDEEEDEEEDEEDEDEDYYDEDDDEFEVDEDYDGDIDDLDGDESSGSKGKRILLIFAILILLLLGGGGAAWYLGYLTSVPYLPPPPASDNSSQPAADAPAPTSPEQIKNIVLKDVKHYYLSNQKAGQLFVIEGKAVNKFHVPKELIKVQGVLYDEKGSVVAEQAQTCGNTLSQYQLQMEPQAKIMATLNNEVGILANNTVLKPGMDTPFMVVFFSPPKTVREFQVKVIEAHDPPKN